MTNHHLYSVALLSIPFCHTALLYKHFVVTSTSSPQFVTVIQLPSLTIYQSRELFGAAPGVVVGMCQAWIHPTSPLILAWSSCAHINPFPWSLNLEPPVLHLPVSTALNGKGAFGTEMVVQRLA